LESEVRQEVEALLGRGAVAELDFEALEMALRQATLRLAACAIEQRLNADTSDELDSRIACRCGGEAQFAGRRSKQFHSVLGPLRLERAYYHCSACGQGCCPRDRHLGMENTSLSPALTRMTGTVGAMVSFQEGSQLLLELVDTTLYGCKHNCRTREVINSRASKVSDSLSRRLLHITSRSAGVAAVPWIISIRALRTVRLMLAAVLTLLPGIEIRKQSGLHGLTHFFRLRPPRLFPARGNFQNWPRGLRTYNERSVWVWRGWRTGQALRLKTR
jgi:hypothetical protein